MVKQEDEDGDVSVVEIKTAARKWSASQVELDLQGSLYSEAVSRSGLAPDGREARLRYDILVKNKKPLLDRQHTIRSPEERHMALCIAVDALKAIELGVDDILTVPFSPDELLARSIVIGRRASGIDLPIVPTIKLGEIELDIVHRMVRAGDSVIHLTGIEQSLMYLLASRAGRVVTRDEILDAVWGTDFLSESNIVDRHASKPRGYSTNYCRGHGEIHN